ncbi:ABC transporter permease [Candidatus Micrarchaeota archaeon]|nr:ABC transporter permease [Candidatus Micrarchaeota archaeon]
MNLPEATKYSFNNLIRRSLRSWLTILGMVVGVIAIVVILSVSEGFNRDINTQMSSFGADMMFVYPISSLESAFSGGSGGLMTTSGKLRQADVDDIQGIPGVKAVTRGIFGRASLSFKGKNITGFIIGVDDEMFDMYPTYIEVESGRVFRNGERNVAFFGNDAANKLFGKDKIEPGSIVQMNGRNFRVVGVQKLIGTSLSSADDAQIYVTFDDARDLFRGQFLEDEVGTIMIQADSGYNPEDIKDTIEHKLAANHRVRVDDKDFTVITSAQISEIVGTILVSIQLVLGAVTLIASVVGAIGIANTMFMNVLERIREIGILKSVGATRNDILMLFLIESAIIGLAGGIIGLALGYLTLELLVYLFAIPVFLRLRIIAFVFIFSIGTGVLAGIIPSWRAAKMDPVEALSYD